MPRLYQTLYARTACQADFDIFEALSEARLRTDRDALTHRVLLADRQLRALATMTATRDTLSILMLVHLPTHPIQYRELDVLALSFARAHGLSRVVETINLSPPPSHYTWDAWVQQIHAGGIFHQDLSWRLSHGAHITRTDKGSTQLEWDLA